MMFYGKRLLPVLGCYSVVVLKLRDFYFIKLSYSMFILLITD